MNPKISIILPVYNVSLYITRCMDSLRNQTLLDIEIIFIDDKGTDNSIDIIKNYISLHNLSSTWKILYSPSNNGPALARNMGLKVVKGEYVAFIDADDWIENEMMNTLYQKAKEHQADICSSASILDYPDGTHKIMRNPYVGDVILTQQQRTYLLMNYISNFTTMIFKRSWIEQYSICFPNAKSGEDSSFMGQCYLVARSIAQINIPFYHYIIHSQSISHKKRVFRGKEKHKAFSALFKFAKTNNLFSSYRWTLCWIYIKKVIISSILDFVKSI